MHELLVRLLKHPLSLIFREGANLLEFTIDSMSNFNYHFPGRKNSSFFCLLLFFEKNEPLLESFVALTSQILIVIGGDAFVFCCSGTNVDFIETLEKSSCYEAGIHYPFSLTPLQFEQWLRKLSFSVMGRIAMLLMLRTVFLPRRGLLSAINSVFEKCKYEL